jgi:hypothetical protein
MFDERNESMHILFQFPKSKTEIIGLSAAISELWIGKRI